MKPLLLTLALFAAVPVTAAQAPPSTGTAHWPPARRSKSKE